jgi:urease accessory protein
VNHLVPNLAGGIAPRSGQAQLHVASLAGHSTVVRCSASNPLRLLAPRSRGPSIWAYTSSFGGGLIAGDQTRLDVKVDRAARCFLTTQASTKIYRNPRSLPCSHELGALIADDALLVLAPDPVQCFAASSYEQRQHFELAARANLVLVDWMSGGRSARGEQWSFNRYLSRNEVHRNGELVWLDSLLLDSQETEIRGRFRTGGFNCLATVVLIGEMLATPASQIVDWVNAQPITPEAQLVYAASPLREGVMLRIAGPGPQLVGQEIYRHLSFVRDLLADDPWARKW